MACLQEILEHHYNLQTKAARCQPSLPTYSHKACALQYYLTTTAIPSHNAICLLVCCKLVTIHGTCMLVSVKQIIHSACLDHKHSMNGDIHQATLWQHSPLAVSDRIHSYAAVTQVCTGAFSLALFVASTQVCNFSFTSLDVSTVRTTALAPCHWLAEPE